MTVRAASLRAMPLRGSSPTVVAAGDRAQDRLISTAPQQVDQSDSSNAHTLSYIDRGAGP
eukprot:2677703-Pyramimonas_sp.AAC.1